MKRFLLLLLTCTVLAGCSRTISNAVHHSVKETPKTDRQLNIVFLPVDVAVYELTASGATEEVPGWSEQGTAMVTDSIQKIISTRTDMKMVEKPKVSEEEQALIDQYLALYDLVAGNALHYSHHPAWKDLREKKGYTLGNGLNFIRDKCEADAALMVIGRDYISSGGRKALSLLLIAPEALGHSVLHAGVVDLKTGNILWMNTSFSESLSLKTEKDAQQMVDLVFDKYMEFD